MEVIRCPLKMAAAVARTKDIRGEDVYCDEYCAWYLKGEHAEGECTIATIRRDLKEIAVAILN